MVFWVSFVLAGSIPYCIEVGTFKAVNVLLRSMLQVPQSLIWVYGGELLPTTHRWERREIECAAGQCVCVCVCVPVYVWEGACDCILSRTLSTPLPCAFSPSDAAARRAAGLAVCNSIGRIAAMSAPLITTACLMLSMSALFVTFMVSTLLGAFACSIYDRETCGEYLAGFTGEASEVGLPHKTATPRRNLAQSPFSDQFDEVTQPWTRLSSSACNLCAVEKDEGLGYYDEGDGTAKRTGRWDTSGMKTPRRRLAGTP